MMEQKLQFRDAGRKWLYCCCALGLQVVRAKQTDCSTPYVSFPAGLENQYIKNSIVCLFCLCRNLDFYLKAFRATGAGGAVRLCCLRFVYFHIFYEQWLFWFTVTQRWDEMRVFWVSRGIVSWYWPCRKTKLAFYGLFEIGTKGRYLYYTIFIQRDTHTPLSLSNTHTLCMYVWYINTAYTLRPITNYCCLEYVTFSVHSSHSCR